MSYTWKNNATASGSIVDPDALNSNLMHLKYDLGRAWKPETVYARGAICTSVSFDGFQYSSSGGTSGSAEPVFPAVLSTQVQDGDIIWTCEEYGKAGSSGGGEGTTLTYLKINSDGDLTIADDGEFNRVLPLPLAAPTNSDYSKAIIVNSDGTSFIYGEAGGGSGTTDHSKLTNRDDANSHPISAITELQNELNSLEALIGQSNLYSSPGTYTLLVPSWANVMFVTGCGGGGGGNASHGLGGGGAQCAVRQQISVTAGETLSLSIGAGGTGATSFASSPSLAPGGNGNSTVITGKLTLRGGYGGGNNPSNQWYGGAAGGTGGNNGGIRMLMAYGGSPTSIWIGGMGGSCVFGAGGVGGYYPNNYAGIPSVNGSSGAWYGAGGGGGGTDSNSNVTSGGNGSGGFLFIEFALI